MTHNFAHLQAGIRGLEVCPSQIPFPCPVLDYGLCWMRSPCVWEESFPSQRAAAQNAEETFLPIYQQAEEWVRCYTDADNLDSWFDTFHRSLNRHLGELRDALPPMRTQQTAPVLNRITALLLPDKVLAELEADPSLLYRAHTLSHPSHYLRHAEYSTYDSSEGETGIIWFLGKLLIRHGYDLLPAIIALEADLQQKAEDYQRICAGRAENAIHKHIVVPLQKLLPMLYQTLSTQGT